ncbi:hypothetical protein [Thauera sp.]|uniref:hypothetical protein n=1 Tax=Thauera sp. TaxID=1905334 RepID=UPI0039E6E76A
MTHHTCNETPPPVWIGDKAALLTRLMVATECNPSEETNALLDRILEAITDKRPAGWEMVEALRTQAVALYRTAEAAMALLPDDELALLIAEHDQKENGPVPAGDPADEVRNPVRSGVRTESSIDELHLMELVRHAESEGIRYEDLHFLAELRRLDKKALLTGEVRLFAARLIAEIITRLFEYEDAIRFVASLHAKQEPRA